MEDSDEDTTEVDGAMPVMVEYEFFDVPAACLDRLPQRVARAVNTLVRRRRVPSDEDVRDIVQNDAAASAASEASAVGDNADATEPARVRVMLPHTVAVELAMHRSFESGGNVEQTAALTPAEVTTLMKRSQRVQLGQLRARSDDTPERRRISPAASTCVICLERVRRCKNRVFLDPCGHVFHKACIVQWLQKLPRQCPLCKVEVNILPLTPRREGMTTRSQTRAQAAAAGRLSLEPRDQ